MLNKFFILLCITAGTVFNCFGSDYDGCNLNPMYLSIISDAYTQDANTLFDGSGFIAHTDIHTYDLDDAAAFTADRSINFNLVYDSAIYIEKGEHYLDQALYNEYTFTCWVKPNSASPANANYGVFSLDIFGTDSRKLFMDFVDTSKANNRPRHSLLYNPGESNTGQIGAKVEEAITGLQNLIGQWGFFAATHTRTQLSIYFIKWDATSSAEVYSTTVSKDSTQQGYGVSSILSAIVIGHKLYTLLH